MDCVDRCDFAGNYERSILPAVKALERDVLGGDYGGTSWTTIEQIPHIISSLGLNKRSKLLEVGSGSGWPGLYLSSITGCAVTLLDMPLIALTHAAERAISDNMTDRVQLVNGDGTALPFIDGVFDRISQSDVLCCLPDKLEMLRECHRVVSKEGRLHFSAIKPAPGLSASDHQRVLVTGPPFVDVPGGYQALLKQSGWRLFERVDVTAPYAAALQGIASGMRNNVETLRDIYGSEELSAAWQHREDQLELVESGYMQRVAYAAHAA